MTAYRRVVAAATGLFAGLAAGVLISEGHFAPLGVAIALAAVLALAVRLFVSPDHRGPLGALVALAYAVHVAAAVVLYVGSRALGRGGFITGDDAGYANLAWAFVQYLRGTPHQSVVPSDWGDAYLFGTYVYLQSAIFALFGFEPLLALVLNAAFAMGLLILVFDVSRRLFDARSALLAAALVGFYPSLVLWSSLNLKDALALLLIALVLWALLRFQVQPRWWFLALAFALLLPMESLRRYVFAGLAIVIPAAVWVAPSLRLRARVAWGVGASAVGLALLAATQQGVGLGPDLLARLESTRQSMAVGARTAYVEPPPVPVQIGETYVVVTPAEQSARGELVVARTLRHLPVGLAHALFAPFPWSAQRALDLVPIIEMLLWDAVVVASLFGIWAQRRRWRLLLPTVLFVVGVLLLFALAEGNVGTLYRHRAMAIPFAIVLASPVLVRWAALARRRVLPRVPALVGVQG